MRAVSILSLVVLLGCDGTTDKVPDAVDTEVSDPDVPTAEAEPRPGQALCAAGGPVAGGGVHGVTCLAPVEITVGAASNPDFTWTPGPTGWSYR